MGGGRTGSRSRRSESWPLRSGPIRRRELDANGNDRPLAEGEYGGGRSLAGRGEGSSVDPRPASMHPRPPRSAPGGNPQLSYPKRIRTGHPGVGLGPAIVKSIAQAHGGTLTLTPRAAGALRHGTTPRRSPCHERCARRRLALLVRQAGAPTTGAIRTGAEAQPAGRPRRCARRNASRRRRSCFVGRAPRSAPSGRASRRSAARRSRSATDSGVSS